MEFFVFGRESKMSQNDIFSLLPTIQLTNIHFPAKQITMYASNTSYGRTGVVVAFAAFFLLPSHALDNTAQSKTKSKTGGEGFQYPIVLQYVTYFGGYESFQRRLL